MKHFKQTFKLTLTCVLLGLVFGATSSFAQGEQKIASGDVPVVNGPKLYVPKTVCDLGEIREGVKGNASFKITNTGNSPLIINDVVKPCGCTQVEFPDKPLQPGDEAFITAVYNSEGRPGHFSKTLTIKHNGEGGNVYVTLKGTVLRKQN